MVHKTLFAVTFALIANTAYAQFSGGAFFNTTPTSAFGAVTNNLVVTNTPTGFVISGQAIVTVTGPGSGNLLTWIVDRPLTNPYGPANMTTTTVLDGYSSPPPGTTGSTQGLVQSIITDYLGTTTSLSSVPMSLVGGVDSPPWISLSNTSAVFSHTSTPGQFLRQTFFLDGIYTAGPGGSWTIDVPVTTSIHVVPEPSSATLLGVVTTIFAGVRRTRRDVKHRVPKG